MPRSLLPSLSACWCLVCDTNKGYGKPTFINGIQVGDLAAIGEEGSTVWKSLSLDLPHSVVHWLRGRIRVEIENHGKKVILRFVA